MQKDICMHGICSSSEYTFDKAISRLRHILKSEYLLSRRNLGLIDNKSLFNGLDYISLCDYEKRTIENPDREMYNAYYAYIMFSMSLIFPKSELEILETKYINKALAGNSFFEYLMHKYGESKNKRYSDYPDEIQIKDRISLEHLLGITYPLASTYCKLRSDGNSQNDSIAKIMEELEEINIALYDYGYGIGIYEPNSLTLLNSEVEVRRVLKYHG